MGIATLNLILQLAFLVGNLVAKVMLSREEVKGVFARYEGMDITPDLIKAIRNELLDKAKLKDPLGDPEIRALLEEGGTDPETLRT